jgi:trigger factor
LNDDFAQDIGDFKTLEELREEVRKTIFREREQQPRARPRTNWSIRLWMRTNLAVPEVFVDQQIQANVESRLYDLAGAGRRREEAQPEVGRNPGIAEGARHTRGARAMLLDKIAEREAIEVLNDEIDREVHAIARRERQPAAAIRKQLEENGTIRRIAMQIRTAKVLSFLFEQSKKVAGEAKATETPVSES